MEEIKILSENIKTVPKKQEEQEKANAKNQQALDEVFAKSKDGRLNTRQPAIQEEIYTQLEEHTDDLQKLARKDIKSFDFRLKAVGDMTFASNFSSASASVAYNSGRVDTVAARPLHIRDLIPQGTMTGSNFIYLKEGTSEGGITTVMEGNTKPQSILI